MKASPLTLFLIFAIAAALIACIVYLQHKRRLRLLDAAFSGRRPMCCEQFYDRYFKHKGIAFDIVEGVLDILQTHLSADLSRLADSDDFSKNLSFLWDFDSMADVEIVCALERKFKIEITNREAENVHTLADLVELVHGKLAGQC